MVPWLLHEDQNELFEIVFAILLNIVFLIATTLLFWILDWETLAFRLAKGYAILWVITFLVSVTMNRIQHFFRVDLYEHSDVFLITNLSASCILQVGWSAFAALAVGSFVDGAPGTAAVILYLIGAISCIIAFNAVSSFYHGHFYRLISLPVTMTSFVVFSVWPVSAQTLFGWFFELF